LLPFSWFQLLKEQCGQHIEWYCTFLAMVLHFRTTKVTEMCFCPPEKENP
jgi:hypothetical protein